MSLLSSVKVAKKLQMHDYIPTNLDIEKRKFFFDNQYNPQFTYNVPLTWPLPQAVDDTHLEQCLLIMQATIKQYGSAEAYHLDARGHLLSREEVFNQIQQYVEANRLTGIVNVETSANQVARTSVIGYNLRLRLPLDYYEFTLPGVLRHEIGTHILRRHNDNQQPWAHNRQKYQLLPYTTTEEGLAVLHAHFFQENRWLYLPALSYCAGWWGQQMSFAKLYKEIAKYLPDPEQRWRLCLRVKRGQSDTSQPGSFPHSQTYLRGIMRVAAWLLAHDFAVADLYLGKIDCADVERCRSLSVLPTPQLPQFAQDHDRYRQEIMKIVNTNKLHFT